MRVQLTSNALISGVPLLDEIVCDRLLPIWSQHRWSAGGGEFFERVLPDLTPIPLPYCRTMVLARLLYVFSSAHLRYGGAEYRRSADSLYATLRDVCWDKTHEGWYHSVKPSGDPHDAKKDLYAHAFCIFGLAHYAAATGDAEALALAHQTRDVIDRHFLTCDGWFSAEAATDWKSRSDQLVQNPHMHLLEAYLVLYGLTGTTTALQDAWQLVRVYAEILRDPETGLIYEWPRRPRGAVDAPPSLVEPGHQFEWSWLLIEFSDLTATGTYRAEAARLFEWAIAHGVDGIGGVFSEVSVAGDVTRDQKRLWPITEAVRACCVQNPSQQRAMSEHLRVLFAHYLSAARGWNELLDRNLQPIQAFLPASSLYHVFTMLAELDRSNKLNVIRHS
jgi:mannose/cellobiose epimerase-like protein (N-acyl-D-glucosamine 2-epimerase family)